MRSWLLVLAFGCSRQPAARVVPGQGAPLAPDDGGAGTDAALALQHLEYVFPNGEVDVFDLDHGFQLLKTIPLPAATTIRGVAGHAASHAVFIAGIGATQYVLKYDLLTDETVWIKTYPPLVDSLCVSPDGARLYVPNGDNLVLTVDASSGAVLSSVTVTSGVHNTICTPDGAQVYVGSLMSPLMNVIATASDTVVRTVGPFDGFVRPFTIDSDQRFVFANVNGLLGFEVADAQSGALLFRVSPPGYPFIAMPTVCPSHGVALSPDGAEVWHIDQPFNKVHVFDPSPLPAAAPAPLAAIALQGSLQGATDPQSNEGWLAFTRDGRYVFVGDAGDVIDTAARTVVAHLEPLSRTRKFLEIDFADGVPVYVSPRASIGGPIR